MVFDSEICRSRGQVHRQFRYLLTKTFELAENRSLVFSAYQYWWLCEFLNTYWKMFVHYIYRYNCPVYFDSPRKHVFPQFSNKVFRAGC